MAKQISTTVEVVSGLYGDEYSFNVTGTVELPPGDAEAIVNITEPHPGSLSSAELFKATEALIAAAELQERLARATDIVLEAYS